MSAIDKAKEKKKRREKFAHSTSNLFCDLFDDERYSLWGDRIKRRSISINRFHSDLNQFPLCQLLTRREQEKNEEKICTHLKIVAAAATLATRKNMSSIVHKKKKSHSSKSGYSANSNSSTIIHCNGKSSSGSGGNSKKIYHKNDELALHPQSQHHQRYKSASAASTGTRILHKRHNIVR